MMIKFLSKRKKENRQSLIIDNINLDSLREQFAQRRNSLTTESSNTYSINENESSENSSNEYQPYFDHLKDEPIEKNVYKMPTTRNEMPTTRNEIPTTRNEIPTTRNEIPTARNEMPTTKYKENEILKENYNNFKDNINHNMNKPIILGIEENGYYNSTDYSRVEHSTPSKRDDHKCNLCCNKNQIKDSFMILTCGHIFHIRCLVDSHYTDANKCGVIDEDYFNSRICCVCSSRMEMEDILYIHNKFYKNTKEYIVRQDETIEKLDKQMTKLKEELRTCYEYKQKLEHQREKSRQITVTINTMI
jgi:hypothetical protein